MISFETIELLEEWFFEEMENYFNRRLICTYSFFTIQRSLFWRIIIGWTVLIDWLSFTRPMEGEKGLSISTISINYSIFTMKYFFLESFLCSSKYNLSGHLCFFLIITTLSADVHFQYLFFAFLKIIFRIFRRTPSFPRVFVYFGNSFLFPGWLNIPRIFFLPQVFLYLRNLSS